MQRHGHDVAIIFVGSVLSHLARGRGGSFPAAKHRVVKRPGGGTRFADGGGGGGRMAATLFVRPRPDAIMRPIPSVHLGGVGDDDTAKTKKSPPTFRVWNARVARNYMKKKKKKHAGEIEGEA